MYDDVIGNMKFVGELFCDFRHKIKGKEYIDGNLSYEGDYLNGKKWNGKGYDKNGNILYELNNGNGDTKEYRYFCRLSFEGKYIYGIRNGKGKEYEEDGSLAFEVEYLNNKNGMEN